MVRQVQEVKFNSISNPEPRCNNYPLLLSTNIKVNKRIHLFQIVFT